MMDTNPIIFKHGVLNLECLAECLQIDTASLLAYKRRTLVGIEMPVETTHTEELRPYVEVFTLAYKFLDGDLEKIADLINEPIAGWYGLSMRDFLKDGRPFVVIGKLVQKFEGELLGN